MRSVALVAVSGAILLAGLGISYAGSELATAGLEDAAASVGAGDMLAVSAELDPAVSARGVYAAKSVGQEHGGIRLTLSDPGGIVIDSLTVDGDAGEARFEIVSAGTYTLEAVNVADGSREIVIAVGSESDESARMLVILGSYTIIAGMLAMGAAVAYAIVRARLS